MKALLSVLLALTLVACGTAPSRQGYVSHVVLVWFKDSVNRGEIAEIRARSLELQTLPGVISIQAGSAVPSQRPIVDHSFDLGLIMAFDSAEAMDAYLTHPRHKAFVAAHIKGRVERLLVYDIVSDTP